MKKLVSIMLSVLFVFSSVVVAGANATPDKAEKTYLFKDKFIELTRYEEALPGLNSGSMGYFQNYDELYYHENAQGEKEWALLYLELDFINPWEVVDVMHVGDRVIKWYTPGAARFPFGYVVYDIKNEKIYDIDYAIDLNFEGLIDSFEALELGYGMGDVDKDNDLSILDATEIQFYLAKLKEWERDDYSYIPALGDFNEDGEMDILDATAIQRKLAGLDVVDTGKFVFYKQDKHALFGDIPDVSDEAVKIEFSSEYELSQFSNAMYDYEVAGDYCTYAIIKSNEQYNMLFNDKAPKFDDEFFDSKWLVVSIVECSDLLTEAPITKLGKVDDTLFVSAFPYRTNPDLPAPEAMQMWLSIVSVDKEQVIDVNNIMHGRM